MKCCIVSKDSFHSRSQVLLIGLKVDAISLRSSSYQYIFVPHIDRLQREIGWRLEKCEM